MSLAESVGIQCCMREQHHDQARPFCRDHHCISVKWPGIIMMLIAHAWQPTEQFHDPFLLEGATTGCICLAVIKGARQNIDPDRGGQTAWSSTGLCKTSPCVAPQAPQYSKGLSWGVQWLEGLGGGHCQSHTGAAQ